MRRLLTKAFSKKAENHYHMVCLDTVFYNFGCTRRCVARQRWQAVCRPSTVKETTLAHRH
jgi:hypothetical protein